MSESSVSFPESVALRSRTPSVDIDHPAMRRGSRASMLEESFENMEIRCKGGIKKQRKISGQSEESPFKVQLKHREADKGASS